MKDIYWELYKLTYSADTPQQKGRRVDSNLIGADQMPIFSHFSFISGRRENGPAREGRALASPSL